MSLASCVERAAAYLAQHGNALQRDIAAAWQAHQPLAPEQADVLLTGQLPEGGWPAFWSAGHCSVDATCYRISQALAAGLALTDCAALERGASWLAQRQRHDGLWQEDDALERLAPAWARPHSEQATLYLTANAGWVMARCGLFASANVAARALAVRLPAEGALPSIAHTQWLAAGLWLLLGHDEQADRAITVTQEHLPSYSASQLVWLLNCLLDSGLGHDHPFIIEASVRLREEQQPDGSWTSDDGPSFTAQVTLDGLRAASLLAS